MHRKKFQLAVSFYIAEPTFMNFIKFCQYFWMTCQTDLIACNTNSIWQYSQLKVTFCSWLHIGKNKHSHLWMTLYSICLKQCQYHGISKTNKLRNNDYQLTTLLEFNFHALKNPKYAIWSHSKEIKYNKIIINRYWRYTCKYFFLKFPEDTSKQHEGAYLSN